MEPGKWNTIVALTDSTLRSRARSSVKFTENLVRDAYRKKIREINPDEEERIMKSISLIFLLHSIH